jgi:copper ion binding protein
MAHLAALIFKVNRPLAKSIFIRKVDLDYARERHTIWYDELMKGKDKVQVEDRKKDEVKAEAEEKAEDADEARKEEKMATVLKVKGMSCQHCVMSVTKALNQLEGIQNVQVDLEKGEVRFENTMAVATDQIVKAITDAGYEVVHS